MGPLGASAKHTLRFSPGRERGGQYLDANSVRSGGFATGGGNFLAPGLQEHHLGKERQAQGCVWKPLGHMAIRCVGTDRDSCNISFGQNGKSRNRVIRCRFSKKTLPVNFF